MSKHTTSTGDNSARDFFAWKNALYRDIPLRKMAKKSTSSLDIRLTASLIADCFGKWGHECRPAAATVAEMIGCTEKTVRSHLAQLVSLGWFTEEKRPGRPTVYAIANPGNHAYRPTPVTMVTDDTNEINTNETNALDPHCQKCGEYFWDCEDRRTSSCPMQENWEHCGEGITLSFEPDGTTVYSCGKCGAEARCS